jgi:hypothetical protein
MKNISSLRLLAPLALTGLLLNGCVVYRDRPVVYSQPAPPPPGGEVVVADPAPPAPLVEVVPVAPGPEYYWVGGSWEWRGRWVWVGGRWAARPHAGAVWIRGGWVHRGHNRVWVAAHWR